MDYLEAIRAESARFGDVVRMLDPATAVPSCPGWTVADLTYHLAEVQDQWARVVEGADGDDIVSLSRPADGDLPATFDTASRRLVDALGGADPGTPCWSWHPQGHSVGWVLRRQTHEALIHRVDAELAAGLTPGPPSQAGLAADGVDEVLTVMLDGIPAWGTFTPDGRLVRVRGEESLVVADLTFRLGRFQGTGPESGTQWDLTAAEGTDEGSDVDRAPVIEGPAWGLDLWLWGRGPLPAGVVTDADPALVEAFRQVVAESTQ
jgi:uncharacterized protein (TIGR03083 family)